MVKTTFVSAKDQLWCEEVLLQELAGTDGASTEEAAWEKARAVLDVLRSNSGALASIATAEWDQLAEMMVSDLCRWGRNVNSQESLDKEVTRYERKVMDSPPSSPVSSPPRPSVVPALNFKGIVF